MKAIVHKSDTRGYANHGWLESHHTFSFANYFNPQRVKFGALRVLNDDIIAGGTGFGAHPHSNMEIISIPITGGLKHRDNAGHEQVISEQDVQVMSAGTGIVHSEMNAQSKDSSNFLQIWIMPKLADITPRYDQVAYDPAERLDQWQQLVGPLGKGGLEINQDAFISRATISAGTVLSYDLKIPGNGAYVFLIDGQATIGEDKLSKRDAVGIWEVDQIDVEAVSTADVLIIEVPFTNS